MLTKKSISSVIDHTYLQTELEGVDFLSQEKKVTELIAEAYSYRAFGICIRSQHILLSKKIIDELNFHNKSGEVPLKIISVMGFPIGENYSLSEKLDELKMARKNGADEFDMVFNYQDFLLGKFSKVKEEISSIDKECGEKLLKIIFEWGAFPSDQSKIDAMTLVLETLMNKQKRFFKTSTGFYQKLPGAQLKDVELMASHMPKYLGIKPAGGISSYEQAMTFINAVEGAQDPLTQELNPYRFRIGSSSLLLKLNSEKHENSHQKPVY
jgi:deoxyribose-phosphate aldolase